MILHTLQVVYTGYLFVWNVILDDIKRRNSIGSEYELGFYLGIAPASLGHIRSGYRSPSVSTACKILDKSGYALTRDLFLSLLPESAQSAFKRYERKTHKRSLSKSANAIKLKEIIDATGDIDWSQALDQVKMKRKISTYKELAKYLNTSLSSIAMYKAGQRDLPSCSKILICVELEIYLDSELFKKVMPSDIKKAILENKLKFDFLPA